jgi:hypothetical protein
MLSSSVSVLVYEKQKLRYLLQESPRSAAGWDPGGPAIERLSSRSPVHRVSYCLMTESMRTAHNKATISVAVTKRQRLRSLDLRLVRGNGVLPMARTSSRLAGNSRKLDAPRTIK